MRLDVAMQRVFAISDIHIDFRDNREWLKRLSPDHYRDDVLILAGDVTDLLELFEAALATLRERFQRVFFVPGNHDLWIRRRECPDSLDKFRRVLEVCDRVGVETRPARVGGEDGVWIVPLFSWYEKPEEGDGSLFIPKTGEDPTLSMWSDNYFTQWPPLGEGMTVADYFLRLNEGHLRRAFDAPVISFSHFLPRTDLIFSNPDAAGKVSIWDPLPAFNFSRVAGCRGLEGQIRRLGSTIHVYGHQHRNRWREVEGVLYVSHCLGYLRDHRGNRTPDHHTPRQIWPLPVD